MDNVNEIDHLLNNGIIIINKPCGPTSHEVTTFVKKLLGIPRSGHAGTLDPDVSGVLPIALGRATKLLQYIAGKEKTYVALAKFRKILTPDELDELFRKFSGTITQTPPLISAVRKVPRKRVVHELKFLEQSGHLILFTSEVEAGTYIRTLCENMGNTLEPSGGRMVELRRVSVGRIGEKRAHTLQELMDAVWFFKNKGDPSFLLRMIRPPELYLDFPKIFIRGNALASIMNGAQIMPPAILSVPSGIKRDELVSIYCRESKNAEDVFVGVGRYVAGGIATKVAVKIERMHVFKKSEVKK